MVIKAAGLFPFNTECAVHRENKTTSSGFWMQCTMYSQNCSKSFRSILCLSNGGTIPRWHRVFTSGVRKVKNCNFFFHLSSWLTTLRPVLESMCQPLLAQSPLARIGPTQSNDRWYPGWRPHTAPLAGLGTGHHMARELLEHAASFIRVPSKVDRCCFSLRKTTATIVAAP